MCDGTHGLIDFLLVRQSFQQLSGRSPDCPSERSRSRGGRYRVGDASSGGISSQINCGSQGGPCDPSTKNHAGGTPASSLLRGYHTLLHPPCRKVRTTFQLLPGSFGSATHSPVPSLSL